MIRLLPSEPGPIPLTDGDPDFWILRELEVPESHVEGSRYEIFIIEIKNIKMNQVSKIENLLLSYLDEEYVRYRTFEESPVELAILVQVNRRVRVKTFVKRFTDILYSSLLTNNKNENKLPVDEYPKELPLLILCHACRDNYETLSVKYDLNPNLDDPKYLGRDIVILDDHRRRYDWQNKILSMIFDEEKDEFIEADDRSVIWVQDKKGLSRQIQIC